MFPFKRTENHTNHKISLLKQRCRESGPFLADRPYTPYKETPLCAPELTASFTVEAAVAFPLFVCFFVTVLFLMRILAVQALTGRAMEQAARTAASWGQGLLSGSRLQEDGLLADGGAGGVFQDDGFLTDQTGTGTEASGTGQAAEAQDAKTDSSSDQAMLAAAVLLCRQNIAGEGVNTRYIRGGAAGMSFLGSEVTGEEIRLRCSYRVKFPTGFFLREGLLLSQNAVQRRWVGWNASMDAAGEQYVYITPEGSAWHGSRNCSYLNPSIREVSPDTVEKERASNGAKYYACPCCGKDVSLILYVTDYGTNYHTRKDCPGLKRTLKSVTRETAEEKGYHACPKCGGE